MWKLLTLQLCLLLAAAEFGAADECELLDACDDSVKTEDIFAGDGDIIPVIDDGQALDNVCAKLDTLKGCVATHIDSCYDDDHKTDAMLFKNVVTFMCTPRGREVTLNLRNTQCFHDPFFDMRLNAMMMSCVQMFQADLEKAAEKAYSEGKILQSQDFCPFITQLDTCIVADTRKMCDDAMATFMAHVWDIATKEEFGPYNCARSVTRKRRSLQAVMPILARGTRMLKK